MYIEEKLLDKVFITGVSVTTNAGQALFTHAVGPVFTVGQEIDISGFTTNTAYNGVFTITIVASPTTFEVGLSFGSNESGIVTPSNIFDADGKSEIFDTIALARSIYSNPDSRFYIEATEQGGSSPTLDIDIESVLDRGKPGGDIGFSLVSLAQITGNGKTSSELTNVPRFLRVLRPTLGGTSNPTFTISVWITR